MTPQARILPLRNEGSARLALRPSELPPTRAVCTRRSCVPQLLAAVAEVSPDSIALTLGSRRMTYGELNAQSDRLARYLQSLGVSAEVPVAVCLERSFEYIVSALAIWKAGGAYLPLDSSWPLERRSAIIADAGASVLIQRTSTERGAEVPRARFVIDPDSDAARIDRAHLPLQPAETKRDQLAYISYTSGTTGKPKGVEITHGNLLNLVFWHRRAFGITANDRVSHLAGLAFDAAAWELWPHLSAGANVFLLADNNIRMSPPHLRDWLVRERINVAFIPTTLAEPLINSPWPKSTALRYLLTGSETLHRFPIEGLPFTLVNNYGPTECAVVATSGVITADEQSSALPCIGTGIANTPIYLLDENFQPVASGATGEIFIGGTNVGRGYRNQPQLTEQFFLPDPFRSVPGARMYRTGDRASRLANGQLQFHGRVDNQQKIRGHRVEPDEIASVLAQHPNIDSCVVTGYGDLADRKLAAYFVPRHTDPKPAELREFLAQRLPDYMIPSAFLSLEAMPLNSSGKVDRAQLPDPTAEPAPGADDYRAPQSPLEIQVAGIVGELLQLDRVGLDDNFFLLGGHSLLGTQLVLRTREKFGVDLTLRHLFETQTVAKLAVEIERQIVAKLESMPEEEAARLLAQVEAS